MLFRSAIYREKQALNGAKGGRPAKPKPNPSLSPGLSESEPKKSSPSPSPIVERERAFSEVPPMNRKDFDTMADMSGVTKDCANWFWNTNEGRGWIDTHGQPIRKVQPLLMNAFKSWKARQHQNASATKPLKEMTKEERLAEAMR